MIMGLSSLVSGFPLHPVNGVIWIEGHITSDTTWNPVDTYRVIDDTYVDPGVTLTIEPGVRVEFADDFSLYVDGSLGAVGTESDPILFTSSRSSPIPGAWNTISFRGVGTHELHYDDGIAENGYAPTSDLYTYAVHFQTPSATPYKLCEVKYYIDDSPAAFYVDIRDASLQQVYYGLGTPTQAGWFTVDLTSQEISVQEDFYVGMKYSQLYAPELGADTSNPDGESGESSTEEFPTGGLSSLDWMIRAVLGGGDEQFALRHAKVEYAVHGVTIESLAPTSIEKSEILSCSETGVYIVGESNALIEGNRIEHNLGEGIATDVSGSRSEITIVNNTISNNQNHGVLIASTEGIYNVSINYNNMSSNGGNAIYLHSDSNFNVNISDVNFKSNNILSNDGIGIYLYGYKSFIRDVVFDLNVVSANGDNGIYLHSGTWRAIISNVTFRSNTVTSNGGDGIALWSVGGGGIGPWAYIYDIVFVENVISSNSQNGINLHTTHDTPKIQYVTFLSNTALSNGGEGIRLYTVGGQLHDIVFDSNVVSLNDANGIYIGSTHYTKPSMYNLTLTDNTASSNNQNGIFIQANGHEALAYDSDLLYNKISANSQKGIWIDGGMNSNLSMNSMSYNFYGVCYTTTRDNLATLNDIFINSYGMNVTAGASVSSEYNYWGDSSGPYHTSLNPEGKGNPVNGDGTDLDFIPFLTSPMSTINERPVASFEVDKTNPDVNETVTFDATGSTDDGRIDYYFFDFGDGTNSSWTPLSVVTHKYASEDTYNATLMVMDDFGVTSLDGNLVYAEVTVIPELPSFIMLPLFMISTLLAAILYRRKHFT